MKRFPSAYVGHAEQKTDMVSTNMMKGINRLTPDHQQVLFGLLASCFSSQTGSKQRGLRCWNLCVVLCLRMPQFSIQDSYGERNFLDYVHGAKKVMQGDLIDCITPRHMGKIKRKAFKK